jgi:hypothetical protein
MVKVRYGYTPRRYQLVLAGSVLGIGLAADTYSDLGGQIVISAAVWGVLFHILHRVEGLERRAFMACLVIATAGEIVLSLGWGLYTYRLGNIPFFVPPGHVLMLVLGLDLAERLSARAADCVLTCAALYGITAAAFNVDTFAIPLVAALAAISIAMPRHRRLYASTFILVLVLELFGTSIGSWTWAHDVPMTSLVTTNPPAVASAFYAVLDALVAAASLLLARCSRSGRAFTLMPGPRQSSG